MATDDDNLSLFAPWRQWLKDFVLVSTATGIGAGAVKTVAGVLTVPDAWLSLSSVKILLSALLFVNILQLVSLHRSVHSSQRLSRVDANVDAEMGTATEQIRVSEVVKRELDRRRRVGETYNEILERLLEDESDLLAGFGRWSDEQADRARELRERSKRKSKERMGRLAEEG